MALRIKTVEYPLDTYMTATTTAVRYDFAAITVYVPETTSRTFRSAYVRVFTRFNGTVAASTTATLVGVKLGAAAFSDQTVTTTFANTGDPYSIILGRDNNWASYFNTNFGTGTSQTFQVGVTFTGGAMIGTTAKLILTYEYDDSAATTRVKTVRIPLESNTSTLTNVLASIGTSQIPNLDTFLPEASKTYRAIWFESAATNGGNATTDFNLALALDAEAESTRALLEQGLNGSDYYEDIWIRNDMTTNATHDFKARSTTTTRFSNLSVILYVTYEYNHSTSTSILNSLVLPFANETGWAGNTTSADSSRSTRVIYIEESGSISLKQSGCRCWFVGTGGSTLNILVGSQSNRAYTVTAGSVQSGPYCLSHRIDSGSAGGAFGTLSRGKNTIVFDHYASAASAVTNFSSVLYLNYTSDKHTDGDGVHNTSTCWTIFGQQTIGTQNNISAPQNLFNIPESNYFNNGITYCLDGTVAGVAAQGYALQAQFTGSEGPDKGWADLLTGNAISDAELGAFVTYGADHDFFTRWVGGGLTDPDGDKMNLETTRKYRMCSTTNLSTACAAWLTKHSIVFPISGSVTGSAGGTVSLKLKRVSDDETLYTTSSSGNGNYTFTWFDDTESVYVMAYEDATHKGISKQAVAGSGFDIVLSSSAGSGSGGGEYFF